MEQNIIEILRDIYPYEDIEIETELIETGILDSMSIILLITELESLYHIQISLENLELEDFANVGNIIKLVEKVKTK